MEQYTSEQALNGILNIIQTVVDLHQKKQESAAQNKTGDLITELLSGVAAASSKDVSIGTQVEALSNGMKAMKDAGVTDRDAKMVAGMITSIGQAIKTLEFSDVNNASVIKMAEALVLLGGILGNIIDNINYLTTLNVRQIRAVGLLVADLSDFNGSVDDFVENINKLASINASAIDNIKALSQLNASISSKIVSFFEKFAEVDFKKVNVEDFIKSLTKLGNIDAELLQNINNITLVINKDTADKLQKFIDKLNISEEKIAGVKNVVEILEVLGKIDNKTLRNIEKLSDIDFELGNKLNQLIKSLDLSKLPAMDKKKMDENIKQLAYLFNSINNIISAGEWRFSDIFLPLRGKILGKAIGKFFEEIIKAVDGKTIKVELNGVADLLKVFSPFLDKDSTFSIRRMRSILNEKTGKEIGAFFSAIIDAMPTQKKAKPQLDGVVQLLEVITNFSKKDFKILLKLLTEENGKQIGGFMTALFAGIPEKTDLKALKNVSQFLKELGSLSLLDVAVIALMSKVLNAKSGQNINDFITKLVDGFDGDKIKAIEVFADAVKKVSTSMLILTASMLLIAGGIALLGVEIILGSIVATMAFTAGILYIVKKLATDNKDIEAGSKALLNVSKAIGLLTANVIALAVLAMFIDTVEWESIAKVAVIMVAVGGIVVAAMWASDKWKEAGKDITAMMKGISLLLLATTVAVGIATMIAKNNELGDVLLGLGVVAAVMLGSLWFVDKLAERNSEDIELAVKNMLMMTGMIALTALTIMFLIVPIASKMEDVVHGSAVVLLVIEAMILMNKQLAKIDADKLKQSVWNLITLTLMFATISLVAAFILPMISENMKNVVIGGVVVLAVIGIMIGMTWLLSKIDAENLEQANKTLLVLTVMLVAVSVVAAFLLPAIGQNWQDVAVGAVVVLAIIGLMVGMVALVNLIKKESLEQTYMTLGVLTVMLVAVSLVANFLLPEIGKNWKEVALGGVVVMGIIALMVGMAWLTSLIGQDTLKETYITLGVLTLMLVAVSLVTKFILIPIGEEWKEAALGGVVVMGIMALMVGMTWVLSTIDEDKMKQAWISLAVMTVCLLVVSLIVSELLIPIGYEWDAAAIGGAVVLGVIAIMTAIVAAAAQIKREKVINGAITMAVVAGMLWAVSTIIEENFIPIGDEWEAAALGGAVILGTIGIMTAIIAAAGQMDLKTIGKGALAIAAVTGLLWLIGKAFEPYIQTSLLMYENAKEVAIGGAEIIATIIVFGLIMTGIGALMTFGAAFMAMGAAAIAGITGIIYLIAEAFPPYIELTKLANENKSAIRNGSGVVVDIIEQFGLLMGKIGAMMLLPFVGVALAAGAAAIAGITATIALIGDSLDPFVAVMIKIRDNNINQQSIKQFMQVFIGNGIKDKETPSLYNSIVQIVEALNEVGVWSATMAGVIAKNLRPIFETLGMFIDVIGRICSMKYVSEWNTDGTPAAYETISMPMFREAGNTISTTFGTFLTELGRGLDAIKDVSYVTIMKLASGIGPIMSSVKNFTDAILSVISSKIPEEYDEEGKVIKWRSFNNEEFGNAAVVISDAFMTFLEEFGERSKNVSARSAIVISLMKEGIEPVMNAVATYTQTIMDFVVGKEVEYTDVKTGKNVKKIFEISPQKFKEYGTTIAETFIGFIESMWKAFNEQGYTEHHYENMNDGGWFSSDTIVDNAVSKNHITDLIAGMSGISQIMQAVQTFIDVIFKTAEAAGKVNLESEGQKISRTFTGFINALVDAFLENETTNIAGFKFEDTIVSKKMTATIDGLNKSNKMIKTFDNVYKNLSKVVQKYAGTITDDLIDSIYATICHLVLTDSIETIKKLNDVDIKPSEKYFKSLVEISSQLSKIARNLEKYDEIQKACTNIVTDICILNPDLMPSDMTPDRLASTVQYMKKVNDIADELNDLEEKMNASDLTDACLKFIRDIEILTGNDIRSRADSSRRSLNTFSASLRAFNRVIVESTVKFKRFTASVTNAKKSLEKLDDVILKNEEKRNASLKKMGELIQGIADAVNSLRTEIENLDENKILRNFRAIQELLEEAKRGNDNNEERPQNNQNQNNQNQRTGLFGNNRQNNQNNNQNVQVIPVNARNLKTLVQFTFENVQFSGWMENKVI